MRTAICLIAASMIALLPACSSSPKPGGPPSSRPVTLADPALAPLAWMVGEWISLRDDGSVLEECWQPAIGPCMVGSFRAVRTGEIGFYEIMTIEVEDGVPHLRIKHFNAQLVGWEDKGAIDGWPMVDAGPMMAAFELAGDDGRERLTFTRTGESLAIDLLIVQGDAERTVPFRFTRR